ncbi:MAG: ribonuclease III [Lachnospiraceae bacterium]|jgi:ribonuclease-3
MNKKFSELEIIIGYSFTNKRYLETALTHSSYVNESKCKCISSNERMEFFGDAIIEFYVSEFLYENFKDFPEGDLTKTRATMVCRPGLAECAKKIRLGEFILMGKGEENSGGRDRASIISDAFEALVAAIYLDGGWDNTRIFLQNHLLATLKDKEMFYDAKTRLQEIIQKDKTNELKYSLIEEIGLVHERTFVVAALLNGVEIGRGSGHSKKEAQQHAAMNAIETLKE